MKYRAVVTTGEGKQIETEREAGSRLEASRLLRGEGMTVLSIEERRPPRSFSLPSFISRHISNRDRIMFARNLSAML
jgi:type II secretory pathway component PulF